MDEDDSEDSGRAAAREKRSEGRDDCHGASGGTRDARMWLESRAMLLGRLLLLLPLPLPPLLCGQCVRPLRLRKKQVIATVMVTVPSIAKAAAMPIYVAESRLRVLAGAETIGTVCMEGETVGMVCMEGETVGTVCMEGEANADGSARGRVQRTRSFDT